MSCYDWLDGKCHRGSRCRFSHEDIRRSPERRRGSRRDDNRDDHRGRDDFRRDDRRDDRGGRGRSRDSYYSRRDRERSRSRRRRSRSRGGRSSRNVVKVGKVRRICDNGYGFIDYDGHKSIFFHTSGMARGEFERLREGDKVEFESGWDERSGKGRAENVIAL